MKNIPPESLGSGKRVFKKGVLKPFAFHLAMLGMVTSAVAAEDADALYFTNLPIVASVSRLSQPLSETPGAVTVIDRDMIRASGAREVADLLRLVPGFSVAPASQEPAIVAYHGILSEEYTPRVQVLIDGRSLYSPLFKSGVNWNLIPVTLNDIERIEVVRGSNTVSYGSNALFGIINIITQHASLARGWLMQVSHGNNSVREEQLRYGAQIGNADFRLSYRQSGDDGLKYMTTNDVTQPNVVWFNPHDSRHTKLLDLRADVPLTDRDELQLGFSQAYDVSQYGRFGSTSDVPRDMSRSSSNVSAEWRRILKPGEEFKLRFAFTEDWASDRYVSAVSFTLPPPGARASFNTFINAGGRSTNTELEAQYLFAPSATTRLVSGTSVQHSAVRSTLQFYTADWHERSIYRVFSNLEWRPSEKWLFNAGASLQHDSIAGWGFDPRLAANYHLTPTQTLRLGVSRARRTPSLYEAQGDTRVVSMSGPSPVNRTYLASPGLQAERLDTIELGYLGEFKSLRASVDVRAFNERIPNRIQIVPRPLSAANADDQDSMDDRLTRTILPYPYGRADSAVNLEHVSIRGYEYQIRWQPVERTRLLFSHAYIDIYASMDETQVADRLIDGDTGNIGKISRQTRESAPRHASSAMLMQKLPWNLEASVMYYQSGFMRWRRNSYTRPFERWDWRLAYPFRSGNRLRGEVAYTVQASNGDTDASRETRRFSESHWLSLRLEY